MADTIRGDDLRAEKAAFTFSVDKGEELREVPFVYFPNFIARVADIIHQHKR